MSYETDISAVVYFGGDGGCYAVEFVCEGRSWFADTRAVEWTSNDFVPSFLEGDEGWLDVEFGVPGAGNYDDACC